MEYKAKKRTLNVEFDGVTYPVRFPTVGLIEDMYLDFDKKSPKEQMDSIKQLLDKSGLPLGVCNQLEAEDLNEIVQILTAQKKTQ